MMRQMWRYWADMGWPTAAYVASVIAAIWLQRHLGAGWPRLAVALLPLPAVIWMAAAELARLRRRDELRQRIEMEVMTVAFALSFLLMVMAFFLHELAGLRFEPSSAVLFMSGSWIVGQVWVRARYRHGWLQDEDER